MSNFEKSKMPKKILAKWLAALRSGEYKRGKSRLYDDGDAGNNPKFCCLGVLQHCLTGGVEFENSGEARTFPSREWLKEYDIHFRSSGLTQDYFDADVKMGNGKILPLSDLNDSISPEYSFKKIANYIEKNFVGT
jgi:hypothetical protein